MNDYSLNKSKIKSPFLRITSAVLVAAFFGQELALADPGFESARALAVTAGLPKLPASVAWIDESHVIPGAAKTVYLIQDAHTNESAQLHIAACLDELTARHGVRTVFLEAGTGDDSLSMLRIGDAAARRKTALSFLRKGWVQGPDYFDLTSDRDVQLWGVEEPELYWQSLELYRGVRSRRADLEAYLDRVDRTARSLKPHVYNPALLSLDARRDAFLKNELSFTEYVRALLEQAAALGIDAAYFPKLSQLDRLRRMEREIDFQKAAAEQVLAVEALSEEDRAELALASDERSPEKWGTGDAERRRSALDALLDEKIRDRSKYPALDRYFKYVREARKLDAKTMFEERETLEDAVFSRLATMPDEAQLRRVARGAELARRLFRLSLLTDEFRALEADESSVDPAESAGFLNRKIMDLGRYHEDALFFDERYAKALDDMRAFYRLTLERDRQFVRRAIERMDATGETRAVLVAGGFHAPHLKETLRENGVSFVSIVPQVLGATNEKKYESVLLGQIHPDSSKTEASQIGIVPARQLKITNEPDSVFRTVGNALGVFPDVLEKVQPGSAAARPAPRQSEISRAPGRPQEKVAAARLSRILRALQRRAAARFVPRIVEILERASLIQEGLRAGLPLGTLTVRSTLVEGVGLGGKDLVISGPQAGTVLQGARLAAKPSRERAEDLLRRVDALTRSGRRRPPVNSYLIRDAADRFREELKIREPRPATLDSLSHAIRRVLETWPRLQPAKRMRLAEFERETRALADDLRPPVQGTLFGAGARLADWQPLAEFEGKIEVDKETGHIRFAGDPLLEIPADLFDFYFVRHGETEGNARNLFQGAVDEPQNQLNEHGRKQAAEAAELTWKAIQAEVAAGADLVVVSSRFRRARDTAQAFRDVVRRETGTEPAISDERFLGEISFGVADNKNEDELKPLGLEWFPERYRHGLDATVKAPDEPVRGDGGKAESYSDLIARQRADFLDFIARMRAREATNGGKKIVVAFGHGTASSAMRVALGDRGMQNASGFVDWRANMLPNAKPVRWDPAIRSAVVVSAAWMATNPPKESKYAVLRWIGRHPRIVWTMLLSLVLACVAGIGYNAWVEWSPGGKAARRAAEPQITPEVRERLASEDPNVVAAALDHLRQKKVQLDLEVLRPHLESRHAIVVLAALNIAADQAIAMSEEELAPHLASRDPKVVARALDIMNGRMIVTIDLAKLEPYLASRSGDVFHSALLTLEHRNIPVTIERIRKLLEREDATAVEILMRIIHSQKIRMNLAFLESICFVRHIKVPADLLRPYLSDRDPKIRKAALDVAYFNNVPVTFAELKPFLNSTNLELVRRALSVIQTQEIPFTLADLRPYLRHADTQVRSSAIEVLGQSRLPVTRETLEPHLKSKEGYEVSSALKVWKSRKLPATLADLKPYLEHGYPFVVSEALEFVLERNLKVDRPFVEMYLRWEKAAFNREFVQHRAMQIAVGQGISIDPALARSFLDVKKTRGSFELSTAFRLARQQKIPITREIILPLLTSKDTTKIIPALKFLADETEPAVTLDDLKSVPVNDLTSYDLLRVMRVRKLAVTLEFLRPLLASRNRWIYEEAYRVLAESKLRPALADLKPGLESDDFYKAYSALDVVLTLKVPVGRAVIEPFLKREEWGLTFLAIQIIDDQNLPFTQAEMRPYVNHSSAYVCDAALELFKKRFPITPAFFRPNVIGRPELTPALAKAKMEDLTIGEVVALSTAAGPRFDPLLAFSVEAALRAEYARTKTAVPADLPDVRVAVLHFLSANSKSLPAGAREQSAFARKAADAILAERKRVIDEEIVVFGPGRRVLIGLNQEGMFELGPIRSLAEGRGSKDVQVIRGSLDVAQNALVKAEFLRQLTEFSRAGRSATVWTDGHGGPSHFWFSQGQLGSETSDSLKDPRAVSYEEFAKALVDGQGKVVDLRHLLFVNDACYQYDLALRLMTTAITAEAERQGKTVRSLPILVATSNRGRLSYGDNFLKALGSQPVAEGKPLLLKHVLDADRAMRVDKAPQDPAVLVPIDPADFSRRYGLPAGPKRMFLEISQGPLRTGAERTYGARMAKEIVRRAGETGTMGVLVNGIPFTVPASGVLQSSPAESLNYRQLLHLMARWDGLSGYANGIDLENQGVYVVRGGKNYKVTLSTEVAVGEEKGIGTLNIFESVREGDSLTIPISKTHRKKSRAMDYSSLTPFTILPNEGGFEIRFEDPGVSAARLAAPAEALDALLLAGKYFARLGDPKRTQEQLEAYFREVPPLRVPLTVAMAREMQKRGDSKTASNALEAIRRAIDQAFPGLEQRTAFLEHVEANAVSTRSNILLNLKNIVQEPSLRSEEDDDWVETAGARMAEAKAVSEVKQMLRKVLGKQYDDRIQKQGVTDDKIAAMIDADDTDSAVRGLISPLSPKGGIAPFIALVREIRARARKTTAGPTPAATPVPKVALSLPTDSRSLAKELAKETVSEAAVDDPLRGYLANIAASLESGKPFEDAQAKGLSRVGLMGIQKLPDGTKSFVISEESWQKAVRQHGTTGEGRILLKSLFIKEAGTWLEWETPDRNTVDERVKAEWARFWAESDRRHQTGTFRGLSASNVLIRLAEIYFALQLQIEAAGFHAQIDYLKKWNLLARVPTTPVSTETSVIFNPLAEMLHYSRELLADGRNSVQAQDRGIKLTLARVYFEKENVWGSMDRSLGFSIHLVKANEVQVKKAAVWSDASRSNAQPLVTPQGAVNPRFVDFLSDPASYAPPAILASIQPLPSMDTIFNSGARMAAEHLNDLSRADAAIDEAAQALLNWIHKDNTHVGAVMSFNHDLFEMRVTIAAMLNASDVPWPERVRSMIANLETLINTLRESEQIFTGLDGKHTFPADLLQQLAGDDGSLCRAIDAFNDYLENVSGVRLAKKRVPRAEFPRLADAPRVETVVGEFSGATAALDLFAACEKIAREPEEGAHKIFTIFPKPAQGVDPFAQSHPFWGVHHSLSDEGKSRSIQYYLRRYVKADPQITAEGNSYRILRVVPATAGAFETIYAIEYTPAPSTGARMATPAGARLAAEFRSPREPRTEWMDDRADEAMPLRIQDFRAMLFGVSEAFGATALDGRQLPVQFLPSGPTYLFKLKVRGGRVIAQAAEGLTVELDPSRERPELKISADGTAELSAQDLRTLNDAVDSRVDAALGSLELSNTEPVILEVQPDFLDAASFDAYAEFFLASIRGQLARTHGKNVFLIAVGKQGERLADHPAAAGLFLKEVPKDLEKARRVRIASSGAIAQKDRANVPVNPLTPGDVPAFGSLVRLAIAAGRIDTADVPEGFRDTYAALAGERPEKPVLESILNGTAEAATVIRFALKALTRVSLNSAVRFFRMMKRMIEQAA